jgi:hypothetical protein
LKGIAMVTMLVLASVPGIVMVIVDGAKTPVAIFFSFVVLGGQVNYSK